MRDPCCGATVKQTLLLDLGRSDAHLSLGGTYLFGGDIGAAEQHFRRTIELDQNAADAYTGCALVHLERGKADAAHRALGDALNFDPNCASALWVKAGIASERKDDAEMKGLLAQFAASHSLHYGNWTNREVIEKAGASATGTHVAKKLARLARRRRV